MIRCEVIEAFTLGRFDELENIERVGQDTYGRLNTGDKFECTKDLADYLLGDNHVKRAVVKVIEVIPKKKVEDNKKIEIIKKKESTMEKDMIIKKRKKSKK